MTRVAAVDCGTNSVRLLVADIDGATKHDLHRELRLVRLGQGVDRTGVLAADALERTRDALEDYAATCRDLRVDAVRLVATSATRDATNREHFESLVLAVLGVHPDVVSGDEEASLSFVGATRQLDRSLGPFLIMDIGGGSTELALGTHTVEAAHSMDVGCVRLTERHLHSDPPTAAEIRAAEADVDAALDAALRVVPAARAKSAIGLAGSVTTVAAHALGLPAYDASALHLARLPAADVVAACTSLLSMPRTERAALPFMHPGRVDVIGAGALVLRRLVQRLGLPDLLVSEEDILDGIAWSLV